MKPFTLITSLVVGLVLTGASRPSAQRAPAPGTPRRIVSLVPSTTEMLFAIGAGQRLVGVGNYDHHPPAVEQLPRLGGLLDPNIESLIALRPDLVIVYDTQTELRRQLERAGIPMWNYSIKELSDVTVTIRTLGERVGLRTESVAVAAAIETALRAVQSRVAGRPKPKTLLVFGREPGTLRGISASGGYGFMHDLVELAGGADVLADLKQASVSMSTEMVLARAPEAIVELHYGEGASAASDEAERRVWLTLPSVPAVRSGRITLLTGSEFVVPGPRVVVAAERLARTLHPEAYR